MKENPTQADIKITPPNRRGLKYILNVAVVSLLTFLCYKYFYQDIRWVEMLAVLSDLKVDDYLILALILILSVKNWLWEAYKWKTILNTQIRLSWTFVLASIFKGILFGVITPARVGEYVGRSMFLSKDLRYLGVIATFLCSIAQNVIILSFGVIGLVFWSHQQSGYMELVIVAVILIVFILLLYIKVETILKKIATIKWVARFVPVIEDQLIKKWNLRIQLSVLFASLMRYITYLVQYALTLYVFTSFDFGWQTFTGLSVLFIIQTLIPLTPIMQIVVRGSLILSVFSANSIDNEGLIIATYFIWIVNLLIPSVVGGMMILFTPKLTDNT